MADNPTLTNKKTSFDADTNADIPVRATDRAGYQTQHLRIDIGDAAESLLKAGQQAMTGSVPVVIASDQSAVPISGTVSVTEPVSVDDNGGSLTVDATSWPLPTGAATAANQLPNSHDVTIDNAAGAAAVNIQDGGNSITVDGSVTVSGTVTVNQPVAVTDNSGSITVDNAALSVVGGGVEATALRVTIASDSTGVLSVDDNGGSLTVDGTVAATQSGTWNINNVSGTVSLPTGAATSANQSTEITSLQLIDDLVLAEDAVHSSGAAGVLALSRRADTASSSAGTDGDYATLNTDANGRLHTHDSTTGANSQNVQGPSAIGASISTGNLFPCGFKDLFGNGQVPTGIDASGVIVMGVLPLDLSLNIQDFGADGSVYGRVGSTDDTTTNAKFLQVNSARQAVVDLRREQTVLFAAIDCASSGDNTIVAADATKKIKLLSYLFISAGTVNARWKSGAGTNLSGAMPLIANVGAGLGPATAAGGHLMETAVNQALVLNLSGAVQVSGHISYFLEA